MNALLVFARQPELGRVKTRLARSIGAEGALQVYRELVIRTRAAADGLAVRKTVWFADAQPAISEPSGNDWPGYEQRVQPAGDLGVKMHSAFAQAFAEGAKAVVIIGTDCPGLTTEHLRTAFDHLNTHDVVLGPAADGGYYLLGMNTLYSDFFANKSWSTASVLADTLADAARLGLHLAQLPVLRDVDTVEDLEAWRAAE